MLINELTGHIGQLTTEAASWKVRSIIAEKALQEAALAAQLEDQGAGHLDEAPEDCDCEPVGATDENGMVPEDFADDAIEELLEESYGGTE